MHCILVVSVMSVAQVPVDSLYLTNDHNEAIFPIETGEFVSFQMRNGGHYEVHGVNLDSARPDLSPLAASRSFACGAAVTIAMILYRKFIIFWSLFSA